MLKLLVLGKAGQLATSLQNQSISFDSNIVIHAIGRPDIDLVKPDLLAKAMDKYEPDMVINAAAYTAVDKAESEEELAFEINCDGAANIARLTQKSNIPLIHISTDYVFSGNKSSPYIESDTVGPTGVYGASKLAGEVKVAELNPNHITIRTAWVYSPYGQNFLKTMLRLATDRDELGVVSDQIGNPTDSDDLAMAILYVAQKINENMNFAEFGTYHFCGPKRMNWAEFSREIFAASIKLGGPSARVNDILTSQYPTPAKRPLNSSLECKKFKSQFHYQQMSFEQSVTSVTQRILEITT